MIGKLRGIVDTIETEFMILDVGGVGYKVLCSAATLRNLPSKNEASTLFIETMVREDAFNLYGFLTQSEQNAFKQLIKVGGVGNKVALSILGSLTPEQIVHAVTMQDKSLFQQVSGVGPKMATRLVNELKDSITSDILGSDVAMIPSTPQTTSKDATNSVTATDVQDAISALINLGYQRDIAYKVVTKVNQESDKPLDAGELIRIALKEFATV